MEQRAAGALVLVVDDERESSDVVRHWLEAQGYRVKTANSGTEALRLLMREIPALILSDIFMPAMNGFELCAAIRRDHPQETLPILLMSGQETDRAKGFKAGATEVLRKPLDRDELSTRVRVLTLLRELRSDAEKARSELERLKSDVDARIKSEAEKLGQLERVFSAQATHLRAQSVQIAQEAHRTDVSVVCAELRHYGHFLDTRPPADCVKLFSEFYARVAAIVRDQGGTVGRLEGDRVVAFFNDPLPMEKHEQVAIQSAEKIRESLRALRREHGSDIPELDFSVAVTAGPTTFGVLRFEGSLDYAMLGVPVQLAVRLCDMACGGDIVLADRVRARVPNRPAVPFGPLTLRGFKTPVLAYRLLMPDSKKKAA